MNVETKQTILIKSEQKPELNKYHKRTWDSGIVLNTVLLMWPLAGFCCCSLLRSVIIKGGNSCVTMWGEWASDQTSPSDELRVRMCWLYRLLERRSWKRLRASRVWGICENIPYLLPVSWRVEALDVGKRSTRFYWFIYLFFYCSPQCVPVFIYIYICGFSPAD